MEEKPSYYAIIPADVRYDENLKMSEKMMYGEITCLSSKTGECWASNNYFAKLYHVTPQAISKWIKNLENNHYISVSYEKEDKVIKKRIIKMVSTTVDRVSTDVNGGINYSLGGYQHKIKDNNININNTSNNIKEKSIKRKFDKPTIEQIQEYCIERNNGINAEAFYDFYESKNWYVGKNKMSDWKACVRTWERRTNKHEEPIPSWFNQEIKEEDNLTDEEREWLQSIK